MKNSITKREKSLIVWLAFSLCAITGYCWLYETSQMELHKVKQELSKVERSNRFLESQNAMLMESTKNSEE